MSENITILGNEVARRETRRQIVSVTGSQDHIYLDNRRTLPDQASLPYHIVYLCRQSG